MKRLIARLSTPSRSYAAKLFPITKLGTIQPFSDTGFAMDINVFSIISATTALIAVLVTPFVTLRVAKRQTETAIEVAKRQTESAASNASLQFRSNVLAKNRQDWINTLRDELANFTSLILHADETLAFYVTPQTRSAESHSTSVITEIYRRFHKIRLLSNANEPDHQHLINLLNSSIDALRKPGTHPSELVDAIIAASQQILKREWERVKSAA